MRLQPIAGAVAFEWPNVGYKSESLEVGFDILSSRRWPNRNRRRLHYPGFQCDPDYDGDRADGREARSRAQENRDNSRPNAFLRDRLPLQEAALVVKSPDGSAQLVVATSTGFPGPDQADGRSDLPKCSPTRESVARHPPRTLIDPRFTTRHDGGVPRSPIHVAKKAGRRRKSFFDDIE